MFRNLGLITLFLITISTSHAVNTFASYDLSVSKMSDGTQKTPTGVTYYAEIIAPEPPPLQPKKVCGNGYSYESASDVCVAYAHLEANCPTGYTLSGETCAKSDQIGNSKNYAYDEETCWDDYSYCDAPKQRYYINGKRVKWTNGAHIIVGDFGAYTRYKIGRVMSHHSHCDGFDTNDACRDGTKYGYNVKHVQPALQSCPLGYSLHASKCRKTKAPKIIYV